MKFSIRLTSIFFVLTLIPILFLSLVSINNLEDRISEQIFNQLISIADVQEKRVNEALDRYIEQVKLIASRTQLRTNTKAYQENKDEEILTSIERILSDAIVSVPTVLKASIYDKNGNLILSSSEEVIRNEIDTKSAQTFKLEKVIRDINNSLEVLLVGPLFIDSEIIGYIEVVSKPDKILAITEDYTGLGETGEVMLVKKNNAGDAVFLTPIRFDSSAALRRAIPGDDDNFPVILSIRGHKGILIGDNFADYRGEKIFAVTRFIDALDWGLVVKIDKNEALKPVQDLRITIFTINFITLILVVLISYFISKSVTLPIFSLSEHAKRLQKGDFSKNIKSTSKDEFGVLADSFNNMTNRLKESYKNLEKKVIDRTKDLEESRAKDEAILSSIGDGLVFTDKDKKVVFVNDVVEELLGYKVSEMVGNIWTDIIKAKDEKDKPIEPQKLPINFVLSDKKKSYSSDTTHPIYYTNKNGKTFPVSITASKASLKDKTIGTVIVFRDISKAKELDKAKSDFISIASHQLRTPMTSIKWVVERFLKKEKVSKKGREYLSDIHNAIERLSVMVDLMLNVSRIESGQLGTSPQPIEAINFIENYLKENAPLIEKKNLKVVFKEHPDKLDIVTDNNSFRNIVQSIISNALEYTPDSGEIIVSIQEKSANFLFKVSDTGIGIPKEQQNRMFEKFYRADNAQIVKTDGTGLGLYIAKQAVDILGGKIWFESEKNKGTTFFVELPKESKEIKGEKRLA